MLPFVRRTGNSWFDRSDNVGLSMKSELTMSGGVKPLTLSGGIKPLTPS